MTKPSILLVEDNAVVAMHLQMSLQDAGCEVLLATTGSQAVELARRAPPALCVMDVNLPGGESGFEAAEAIRAHGPVPIIFLTGYDDDSSRARARHCGGVGYFVKPVSIRKLLAAIDATLGDGPRR